MIYNFDKNKQVYVGLSHKNSKTRLVVETLKRQEIDF